MFDPTEAGWWGWSWRFVVAIILDVLDFTIGRIPGFGTVWDVGMTAIGFLLWGPVGTLQFLEVIDLSDQLDAEVPTLTIAGIVRLVKYSMTRD